MSKKILICCLLIITVLFGFTGCNGYNAVPIAGGLDYKDSSVEKNGGLIAKQGNYLYFINGLGEELTPNKFGQVIKGSIMRCELNDGGAVIDGSYETVVPKKVLSGYEDGGFYIFNEWIYYVTPTEAKNSNGQVQTEYIEFMRTKTDGTGTEMIKRLKGKNTQYAFMPETLLLYTENKIISVNCSTKKETIISEDVSQVIFPKITYRPDAQAVDPDKFFYYTKTNIEDKTYASYNQLCASNADGSVNIVLIDKFSYQPAFDPSGKTLPDFKLIYTFSIIKYEDGKLFYNKSYEDGGSKDAGVYSYNLSEAFTGTYSFDKSREKRLSSLKYTNVINYADGILAYDGTGIYYEKTDGTDRELIFTASVIMLQVKEGYLYFRESDGKICRFNLAKKEDPNDPGSGNLVPAEIKQTILKTAPDVTWLKPVIFGDYIFYIDAANKYAYMLKIGTDEAVSIGKWTNGELEASASAAASATPTNTPRPTKVA